MQPEPDLRSLLPYARLFSEPDFTFGHWAGGETTNGVTQTGYFALSQGASAFVTAAYDGHWVSTINWSAAPQRHRFEALCQGEAAMQTATADDLSLVITTLIRGDRFNEGMLASAFEQGILHRVLARIETLAQSG